MSLAEVQARAAELQMRLRQLSGPSALRGGAGGPLGISAGAPSFADALSAASATGTASAAAGTGARTGAGTTGADVVATAKKQLGQDYVWGGESRSEGGFDCSGLIQWAYKEHGIELPRVSRDQAKAGREVSAAEARPGDLVFFERPHPQPDHIGLYAGNGQWVVAPKTGDVVKMQNVDLSKATTIRRVLPDGPAAPASVSALRGSGVEASSRSSVLGPGLPAAGQRYAGQIEKAAADAGISPHLLAAVAWSESGFDPSARSGAGAVGLVQLMPRTAAGLGVTDPTDPVQSLRGGATYLRQQLDAFSGSTELALAAYNAGPTAVRKHGGVPPYRETQNYVDRVLTRVRTLGGTP